MASPNLANTPGGLHGGIGVLMAERALQRALADEESQGFALVELRATYPRPIVVDESPIECRATVTYRGRRLVTIRSELLDQRGRIAVVADSTFIATADGPAQQASTG